jgi:hypothetical protein
MGDYTPSKQVSNHFEKYVKQLMFFTFKVRLSEVVAAVMTLTSCCQSSGVTILLVTFSTPACSVSNKMPLLNFAKFTH